MKPIVLAANWKMNLSQSETESYFAKFSQGLGKDPRARLVFAMPNLFFARAQKAIGKKSWNLAAQNFHEAASGAFTGEVSLNMLREVGIEWALIGHSERRQFFGETDQSVARKVKAATSQGFYVVACVGETRVERERSETESVLKRQTSAILAAVQDPSRLMIAYEPVWAIGTGLTATKEQAEQAHLFIRSMLTDSFGLQISQATPILYGGSVKADNIADLIKMPNINGALVGGASLDGAAFADLVNRAESAY
jgi:triosephosphate isomerase